MPIFYLISVLKRRCLIGPFAHHYSFLFDRNVNIMPLELFVWGWVFAPFLTNLPVKANVYPESGSHVVGAANFVDARAWNSVNRSLTLTSSWEKVLECTRWCSYERNTIINQYTRLVERVWGETRLICIWG